MTTSPRLRRIGLVGCGDVARCTSLEDMPDLDALVITSPAGVHAEHVTWAAAPTYSSR